MHLPARDPKVATPLIQLAPMEGVLDWVFRELLSEVGGIDRMVTEFVRVTDKLLPDHVFHKYCPELRQNGRTRAGTPVFIQLLGGQPPAMAENADRAAALGAPGLDLNFGCPAKTVNRHDGGAALLKTPERLYQVTRAVRDAVPAQIPVTAKVRLGFDHKEFHREIAQAVEEAGAAHIVVHARTKAEMYTPPAHWHFISSMRQGREIPFLANGEIWSVADYRSCREASGVENVALGRGLVRRPTLGWQIRSELGLPVNAVEFEPSVFLQRLFDESLAFRGDAYAVARFKQILRYWAPADSLYQIWFNRAKVVHDVRSMKNLIGDFRKESSCPPKPFEFTPGPTAPTACAPRTF
jgi:tRNA-dihydrouridine synthase C